MPPFHRAQSTAVLVARIVLFLAALCAVVVAIEGTGREPPNASGPRYACPMHAEVTSSGPGDCPICQMALEPVVPKVNRGQAAGDAPEDGERDLVLFQRELRGYGSTSRAKVYPMALEMRAQAWAEDSETCAALVKLDEEALLRPGESATFYAASEKNPGAPVGVALRLTSIPRAPWDRKTALVRLKIDGAQRLTPGQTGTVKFAGRERNGLVVRASAILESPDGPYVLVVSDDRRVVTKRDVVVGNVLYGYADIVSGLREDEYVAWAHAFFLDAERQLRERAPL